MSPRSLLTGFAIPLLMLSTPSEAKAGDASIEVDAAYARLAAVPYRKRETVLGPAAMGGGLRPVVTDVVGDRTRMSYEIDVPGMGTVRSESITFGQRRAVRTVAPGLVATIEKAKQRATVSSVRSLLNQIASVAVAIQTGGLSSGAMIQEAIRAGATMKSAVDARRVLDQAARAFDTWQLVPPDEEDDNFEFADDGGAQAPTSDGLLVTFVSVVPTRHGALNQYQRRSAMTFPGMPAVVETLMIDVASGLPVSEVTSCNGQSILRVEYFDVGAAITIDVPDCLR